MTHRRLREPNRCREMTYTSFGLWLRGDEAQEAQPGRVRQRLEGRGKRLCVGLAEETLDNTGTARDHGSHAQ